MLWRETGASRKPNSLTTQRATTRLMVTTASEAGSCNKNRTNLLRSIFDQGFRPPDWRLKQPPRLFPLEEFFEENDDRESSP